MKLRGRWVRLTLAVAASSVLAMGITAFVACSQESGRELPAPDVRAELEQPDSDVKSQLARAVAALGPAAPSMESNERSLHVVELLATLARIERARCAAYCDDLRVLAEGLGQRNDWSSAEACLDVLAQIPGNDDYLQHCIASSNPRMTAAAIHALANVPRASITDQVREVMRDQPPNVVAEACSEYLQAVSLALEIDATPTERRPMALIELVKSCAPSYPNDGPSIDRVPVGLHPPRLWAVRELRELDPAFLGECLAHYRAGGRMWEEWDSQESLAQYFDADVQQAWLQVAGPRPEIK